MQPRETNFVFNTAENITQTDERKNRIINKDDLRKAITDADQSLSDINNHIKECEVNKANSEKIRETIIKLNNCPTCQQEVSAQHKVRVIERERTAKMQIENALITLRQRNQEKGNELDKLKKELDNFNDGDDI